MNARIIIGAACGLVLLALAAVALVQSIRHDRIIRDEQARLRRRFPA